VFTTFAAELRRHVQVNRAPMMFWVLFVTVPIGLCLAGVWAYTSFVLPTKMPSDPSQIEAPLTDRAWSLYQSLDCIQTSCDSDEAARAFVGASTDGTLTITIDGTSRAYVLTGASDDQWREIAARATADGSITSDVVSKTGAPTSDTEAAFTTPSGLNGLLTFSGATAPQLRSITIGGSA